jgi:hypothetical protein
MVNPNGVGPHSLDLLILDQHIRIRCAPGLLEVLADIFSPMAVDGLERPPDFCYEITGSADRALVIDRAGMTSLPAPDWGGLVYGLEKDITLEIQRRRGDLLFLHAAVVEWQGRVALLAANSGVGKSTTTWGLLNHGFGYLSDELGPVDLEAMTVHPYPHALCLKQRPTGPFTLPTGTLDLGRTLHVPARLLPSPVLTSPRSVGAVFLLHRDSATTRPAVQRVSAAEAAARLYVVTLNALAHPDRGVPAVLSVAKHAPCYRLDIGMLPETCELIRSTLERTVLCSPEGC